MLERVCASVYWPLVIRKTAIFISVLKHQFGLKRWKMTHAFRLFSSSSILHLPIFYFFFFTNIFAYTKYVELNFIWQARIFTFVVKSQKKKVFKIKEKNERVKKPGRSKPIFFFFFIKTLSLNFSKISKFSL